MKRKLIVLTSLALVLTLMLVQLPSAQSALTPITNTLNNYCGTQFPSSGASYYGISSSVVAALLLLSLVIMLAMGAIGGVMYAIGSLFGRESIKLIGKVEIAEILVTLLIVAIFIPTFSLANPTNAFNSDCLAVGNVATSTTYNFLQLAVYSVDLSLVQRLSINVNGNYYDSIGFYQPFSGFSFLNSIITIMSDLSYIFIALLLGTIVSLTIIYNLFPLFLFAGIVLRSIPYSRSAGGSLIAIFMAFFFLFPILLHLILAAGPASATTVIGAPAAGSSSTASTFSLTHILCLITAPGCPSSLFDYSSLYDSFKNSINYLLSFNIAGHLFPISSALQVMVTLAIVPYIYAVFAVVVSFYISYEFVGLISNYLGSPSLSSGSIFRSLV